MRNVGDLRAERWQQPCVSLIVSPRKPSKGGTRVGMYREHAQSFIAASADETVDRNRVKADLIHLADLSG